MKTRAEGRRQKDRSAGIVGLVTLNDIKAAREEAVSAASLRASSRDFDEKSSPVTLAALRRARLSVSVPM